MRNLVKWIEKLVRTPEKTVEQSATGFSDALKISIASGAASGLIAGLTLHYLGLIPLKLLAASAGSGALLGAIGPAISAATVHPLVYFFGGRKYENTYKVFAFHSPITALGTVPVLNAAIVPVALALEARAIGRVHSLDTLRAASTVLVPGIILTAIGIAVLQFLPSSALPIP